MNVVKTRPARSVPRRRRADGGDRRAVGASPVHGERRQAPVTQKLVSPQQPLKLTVVVVAHDSAGAHVTERVPVYLFPPRASRPRKFG